MGPQHDSCGRADRYLISHCYYYLQWGRNMIVAEGTWHLCEPHSTDFLQWGRNMIVAEGYRSLGNATDFPAFNGAAT